MAISVLKEPQELSLSKNPIVLHLKTDNMIIGNDTYSVTKWTIGKNSSQETLRINDNDWFELHFGPEPITFRARANPNASYFEFKSGEFTKDIALSIAGAINAHALLQEQYTVESTYSAATNTITFTFTQKVASGKNNLVAKFYFYAYRTSFFGGGSSVQIIDPVIRGQAAFRRPDFEFYIDLFIETAPEKFERIFSGKYDPDSNNETQIQLQKRLHAHLQYDFPQHNENTILKCQKSIKRYYVRYSEFYDNKVNQSWETPKYYVTLGGFDFVSLVENDSLISYLQPDPASPVVRFLEYDQNQVINRVDQPEFISYINLSDAYQIILNADIRFSDGSTQTYAALSYTGLKKFDKLVIPAGFTQLDLAAANPDKSPVYYELYITAGERISEKRLYQLKTIPEIATRYFLYGTSLGSIKTFRAGGKGSRELEFFKESAIKELQPGYDITENQSFDYNNKFKRTEEVASGNLQSYQVEQLADFFISSEKYIVLGGRQLSINVQTKSFRKSKDRDNLHNIKFEYELAHENELYTDPYFSTTEQTAYPLTLNPQPILPPLNEQPVSGYQYWRLLVGLESLAIEAQKTLAIDTDGKYIKARILDGRLKLSLDIQELSMLYAAADQNFDDRYALITNVYDRQTINDMLSQLGPWLLYVDGVEGFQEMGFNSELHLASGAGINIERVGSTLTFTLDEDIGAVKSVFGRKGDVVAANGDYTTDQVTEAGNKYFTENRVLQTILTGYTVGANQSVTATDTVLVAFGKVQGQINNIRSSFYPTTPAGIVVDWNTLPSEGLMHGTQTATNGPSLGFFTAFNVRADGNTQFNNTIGVDNNSKDWYVRSQQNGIWGIYRKLWDSGNSNLATVDWFTKTLVTNQAIGSSDILIRNGGLNRWSLYKVNTETGSNAGSDLVIASYNDSGSFFMGPVGIRRSDGYVRMLGNVSIGSTNYATTGKLEVLALNSIPADSGNVLDASLSITNLSGVGLFFGQSSSNLYSWIQSRSNSNYATQRPLYINQNGGQVAIGGVPLEVLSSLYVNGGVNALWYKNVNLPDANIPIVFVAGTSLSNSYSFTHTTGSTNFPYTTGGGFAYDRVADYSNTSAIGSFKLWTPNQNNVDFYLRKLTGISTWSNWLKLYHDGNDGLLFKDRTNGNPFLTDLNNGNGIGTYAWNSGSASNAPTTNAGALINIPYNYNGLGQPVAGNSWGHQLAFPQVGGNGDMYYRYYNGTSYSGWSKFWHSGNSNLPTVDWTARTLVSDRAPGAGSFVMRNGSGVTMWNIYGFNAQTGSGNVGYDFGILRYNDAGSGLSNAFVIARSTGFVGIGVNTPAYPLDVAGRIACLGESFVFKAGTVAGNANAEFIDTIWNASGTTVGLLIGSIGTNAGYKTIGIYGHNGTTTKTYASFGDGLSTIYGGLTVTDRTGTAAALTGSTTGGKLVDVPFTNFFQNYPYSESTLTNWNNPLGEGVHHGSISTLNSPTGNYFTALNIRSISQTNYNNLLGVDIGSNSWWSRMQINGVWQPWNMIYDSGNCNKVDVDWKAKGIIAVTGIYTGTVSAADAVNPQDCVTKRQHDLKKDGYLFKTTNQNQVNYYPKTDGLTKKFKILSFSTLTKFKQGNSALKFNIFPQISITLPDSAFASAKATMYLTVSNSKLTGGEPQRFKIGVFDMRTPGQQYEINATLMSKCQLYGVGYPGSWVQVQALGQDFTGTYAKNSSDVKDIFNVDGTPMPPEEARFDLELIVTVVPVNPDNIPVDQFRMDTNLTLVELVI